MKTIGKTRFGLLSALLTIGLLLTGCGSNGTASSENAASTQPDSTPSAQEQTASPDNAEVKTIKAATMGAPAPYITIEDDGSVNGYDFKVLEEVFNRLPQYELEIVVTDIGSVFTGVQSDLYQIGVNNFSYNSERAETYLYSYPYDTVSYVFLSKDGSVKSFADAAGKEFYGQAGISVTNAVESWNEKNPDSAININYTEGDTNLAQQIYDGEVEFTIMDKAMAVEYENEYHYGLTAVDVPDDEAKTIAENSYTYYLFSKENDELRQEINAVLKELKEDGTLTKYGEEVFGFDTSPADDQYEKPIN